MLGWLMVLTLLTTPWDRLERHFPPYEQQRQELEQIRLACVAEFRPGLPAGRPETSVLTGDLGIWSEIRHASIEITPRSLHGLTDAEIAEILQLMDSWGKPYLKCAFKARLCQVGRTCKGRAGAPNARTTNPAPHPNAVVKPRSNIAARPAPTVAAPAAKLPPARPAKMAPWSPKAMSIFGQSLDQKYAAERVDALASCHASLQQWAAAYPIPPTIAALEAEQSWLSDEYMKYDADRARLNVTRIDSKINAGGLDPLNLAGHRAGRCVFQRRLAQLDGSPLIAGAVDGSLTPLSIGGQTPQWKQQGKNARVIASDGKSAMHCVRLEQVASGDSAISGGGRRLFNGCTEEVEITWCNTPGCSTPTGGNSWTVQPGRGWPVSANGDVRWAACLGRDTASFVKGSHGLRYFCSAPATKARR